jgi:hypothetical protein
VKCKKRKKRLLLVSLYCLNNEITDAIDNALLGIDINIAIVKKYTDKG